MSAAGALRERVGATSFVDTHEHLIDETTRLGPPGEKPPYPCLDFALLFRDYARDDLVRAGLPPGDAARLFAPDLEPAEKWRLIAPYWAAGRNSGCLQAVARATELLFGEPLADEGSADRITERMRGQNHRGFYRDVFARAGVETCHVNSKEALLFRDSDDPDILQQDLSLVPLTTGLQIDALSAQSGLPASTLADWHRIIDWAFDRYGGRAVAVKSQAAYQRRLNYQAVDASSAAPLFARCALGDDLAPAERTALEDHLMRECIRRAGERGLPVKLHTGYLAGLGRMPLERLRQNAGDLCPVLQDFPDVRFVLMHIGYPYQGEYVALAKHYPNVWIDLCWAWILNPAASVRFVKEFLLGAPAGKLLTFGGDYHIVEPVVGHAAMARQGLTQALSELVAEGWLATDHAVALVEPLMRGNAIGLFPDRRPVEVPPR